MIWAIVTLIVGYGFGKFGFGWLAQAARSGYGWVKARLA